MGLLKGDLEKVPPQLSRGECYTRIWNYLQKLKVSDLPENIQSTIKANKKEDESRIKGYIFNFEFYKKLPSPEKASEKDYDYLATQVIYGKAEWVYHNEDKNGIKLAAYAHKMCYDIDPIKGFQNDSIKNNYESSSLYKTFGRNWELVEEYFKNNNINSEKYFLNKI